MTEEEYNFDWSEAIEAIKNASETSSIYIGCDSIDFGKRKYKKIMTRYCMVIVIHIDSKHGGKFYHNSITLDRPKGSKPERLMVKLMKEVEFTANVLNSIKEHISDRNVEVHLDISDDPKHASYVAKDVAEGWIKGMGFEPKIKPNSWAATHCADYAVRNLH